MEPSVKTRLSVGERLFLILPFLGLGVLLVMISPLGASAPWPPCPLYALTGTFCPGCGSTRVMLALSEGDLALAWRQNPLVIFALLFLAGVWLLRVLRLVFEKTSPNRIGRIGQYLAKPQKGYPKLLAFTFFIIVAFGVLRNFIPALMPLPV